MSKHQATFIDPVRREQIILRVSRKDDTFTVDGATIIALSDQEYREATKMRGVGDVIAKVTEKVGLKHCPGCEHRRDALNKLMPFK